MNRRKQDVTDFRSCISYIWSGSYEEHLAEIENPNCLLIAFRNRETGVFEGFSLNYIDSNVGDYDDLKEKLLGDYHSGRYTVLPEWE